MSYRIGSGIDFHRLTEGRQFKLGGILIPHHKGAAGHSDADVLLHAICDALLGALSLGDIGQHFPDTDESYRGIDSRILVQKTMKMVQERDYKVVNADCTVCLESPKIMPFIRDMQKTIAGLLEISADAVSVKATTTEKLGAIGREEGVMAMATLLLTHE
jgi:2-C-methyl-D-erythritol 2,4-cyclodiphosphate synthase